MGRWGRRDVRRRLGAVLLAGLLAAGATACDDGGPRAPAPVPPSAPAPAGTVRAEVEAWVASHAFPWVLGRAPSGRDAAAWGDRVVRQTPAGVGRALARTAEARRLLARAHLRRILGREPSAGSVASWADWLATRSADHLDGAVAGSGELRDRFRQHGAWLDHVGPALLGRPAAAGERASVLGALGQGARRGDVARVLVASEAGRAHGVAEAYRGLGLAPPGGAVGAQRATQLAGALGNELELRAILAADRAPRRVRVAVVGDSVGFDLYFRAGGSQLATSVLHPVGGAGRLACGVLSHDPQHRILGSRGWSVIGDGRCPTEGAALERDAVSRSVEVVVWQIGAWEDRTYRDGRGQVLAPRSVALRAALAAEVVRRIDTWTVRGVRRVLLPEWACVGPSSPPALREPAYTAFVRSVLDRVVAARPGVAAIAPTPPQVCVGGDPRGTATREHRVARRQDHHWAAGPGGAAWGWAHWFAPAVADMPGLR